MDLALRMVLGALALLALPAWADAVQPLPGDGRLVYLQQAGQGCVLKLWDSKDGKARMLAQLTECPANVAVASHEQTLALFDAADIRLFDLGAGKLGEPIALPGDVPENGRSYDAWLAGYTPEGVLALEVVMGEPDGIRRLYLLKAGHWVQAEQRQCGYYEDSCPFKQAVDTRPLSGLYGKAPGQIWNDALLGDPYVVERIPEELDYTTFDEEGGPEGDARETVAENDLLKNSLVFRVYGRYTRLRFGVRAGEDTDGTYPTGLWLVTPDNLTLDITDGQFDAVIVGHYLLLYGAFDLGTRLYDLGNGKPVLDNMVLAGWLQ